MIQGRTNLKRTRLGASFCGAIIIVLLAALSSGTSGGPISAKSGVQVKGAQPGTEESGWQKIDAGAFSIFAPSGWTFHQLQGVDSYVGEFSGDGIILKFDFGGYSNAFKEERKPEYVVVHKPIGGLRAKIVSPKMPGHGITGIHFPRTFGSSKLSLFGQDLTSTQQNLVLKIFETIRFGSTVPPVIPPPSKN